MAKTGYIKRALQVLYGGSYPTENIYLEAVYNDNNNNSKNTTMTSSGGNWSRQPGWWNSMLEDVGASKLLAATKGKAEAALDWVGYGEKYKGQTLPHNYGTPEQETFRRQTQEEAIAQWAGDVRESLLKMNEATFLTHWRNVVLLVFIVLILYYVLESIRNLIHSMHVQQCNTAQFWSNNLNRQARRQRRPRGEASLSSSRARSFSSSYASSSEFINSPLSTDTIATNYRRHPNDHAGEEEEEEDVERLNYLRMARENYMHMLREMRSDAASSPSLSQGERERLEEDNIEVADFLPDYDPLAWVRASYRPSDAIPPTHHHHPRIPGLTAFQVNELDTRLRRRVARIARERFIAWEEECVRFEAETVLGQRFTVDHLRGMRRPNEWVLDLDEIDWIMGVPERILGARMTIGSRRMRGFVRDAVEEMGLNIRHLGLEWLVDDEGEGGEDEERDEGEEERGWEF